MVKSSKIYTVQNLTEKLKQARAVVLTNYHGLNVSQINDLRRQIKKAGGEFEVVKNTLLGRAAEESKTEISPESLQGPTAVLWAYEDQISPLKILMNFIKANDLPKIKFGLLDKIAVSIEKIRELASLPSAEELKIRLLGILQSPIYRLTNVFDWNLRKLVYVLKSRGGE